MSICPACKAVGTLRLDWKEGIETCLACGVCRFAGIEMGEFYARFPRGEAETTFGEFRFAGYRPRYYLRERMHNAAGFGAGIPRSIRDLVHTTFQKACERLPDLRERCKDPCLGRFVMIEILRHLAGRKDLDPPTRKILRTPTPKERWTFFWTEETKIVPPELPSEDWDDILPHGHNYIVRAFQDLKKEIWGELRRKNLPFLPYIMGIFILRTWGAEAFLPLAAWWPPPKTTPTLKKCRLFVHRATAAGYLPTPKHPDEEDYPPIVYTKLAEGKALAKKVYSVLGRDADAHAVTAPS